MTEGLVVLRPLRQSAILKAPLVRGAVSEKPRLKGSYKRYAFTIFPSILLFHNNFSPTSGTILLLKKRLIGNYSLLITFYAAKRAFYATFVSQPFFCVII